MRRISIIAAVALVTAALFPASWNRVDASSRSTPVNGHIRSQMVAGPFCTSPVQLCTAGRFNGGIQGEFEFTATSLTPTPTAGVFFYTGTIVVHTQRGELFCADAGVFNTAGDGELADLCTITGGTGDLAGASGYLQTIGTFTAAAGGDSDYRGKLTTP
jgi:hypothetical protein